MPRIVNAEGQTFSFPDDASEAEITQAVNAALPAKQSIASDKTQMSQEDFQHMLDTSVPQDSQDKIGAFRKALADNPLDAVSAIPEAAVSLGSQLGTEAGRQLKAIGTGIGAAAATDRSQGSSTQFSSPAEQFLSGYRDELKRLEGAPPAYTPDNQVAKTAIDASMLPLDIPTAISEEVPKILPPEKYPIASSVLQAGTEALGQAAMMGGLGKAAPKEFPSLGPEKEVQGVTLPPEGLPAPSGEVTPVEPTPSSPVPSAQPRAVEPNPTDIIDELRGEVAQATAAGDTQKAEVGQNMLNTFMSEFGQSSDNMGQELNQSTPHDFAEPDAPLPPSREAILATDEPLSPEELQARISAVQAQTPPAPEQMNDGTSALGVNDALPDTQIGNTQKVRLNSEPYTPNPNDELPRDQRQILFGPQGTVGQSLATVKTEPGTYTIGQPTVDRSLDVLAAHHDLYEELRQRFMPDATLIISNEGLTNPQSVGEMRKLQSGEYLIVPAFARQFSSDELTGTQDANSFNAHTKAKAFYNVFHEFGHALTLHSFFEDVNPEVRAQFLLDNQSDTGLIRENTIAQLPPAQADLVREYNQMRQDVMTHNMAWFQHTWMSPALAMQRQLSKENRALPDMNAYSFIRRLVARGNPQILDMQTRLKFATSSEERLALQQQIDKAVTRMANDYLSFDEFMAEKMARYAYETGLGSNSKLASGEMFGGGISHVKSEEALRNTGLNSVISRVQKSLRNLFIALKKGIKTQYGTYRISAGTSFARWVESLGKVGQAFKPTKVATSVSESAFKTAPSITTPEGLALPKVAHTQRVVELNRAVTFGRFSPKEKQELYKLIRQNAVNEVHERMVQMLEGRIKHQLELNPETGIASTGGELAEKEWEKLKEKSPYFKNWFGDWENDALQASKVVSADGVPLVLFHATRGDFEKFTKGDIGFHFGDLMAAHARLYTSTPKDVAARIALDEWRGQRNAENGDTLRLKDEGMNIIPAYLNIRNPLELDEQNFEQIWEQPSSMALFLEKQGILTEAELADIHAQAMDFTQRFSITDAMLRSEGAPNIRYQMFQPLRKLLQDKGYDGIKYKNAVEGSTSWAAFSSAQIKTANGKFNPLDTRIHMQRDLDLTTATGLELDTISRKMQEFENMGFVPKAINFFARSQWYVMQLQQLAHIHPEYHFLDLLNSAAMQYTAVKSRLQAMGESLVQEWKNIGKENEAKLAKILEKEVESGAHWTELVKGNDGLWQHKPTEETLTKLAEMGVTQDTAMGRKITWLYMQSKNVLVQQLDAARQVMERKLAHDIQDEGQFLMQLNSLRQAFKDVRDIPFLPRGDYGRWGITITEQKGLERKTIFRQMFESNSDLVKAHAIAEKNLEPGQKIKIINNFPDEHRSLLALPAEFLDQAAMALDMTQEEKDTLHDLLQPIKQEKLLKPYMKAMEKVSGGSKDRMRNFADFVWHNSTMIARTEAAGSFAQAKRAATDMYNEVNAKPMDSGTKLKFLQDLARAQKFMQSTIDYTLSPPNELYRVRSTIAVIYLFGGIKTAMLNLAGLITTWGALGSQHGEVLGDAALVRANKQLTQLVAKGNLGSVSKDVETLYNKAINEGFIVQNYAAHLGAAATAGTARRLVNRSRWTSDIPTHLGQIANLGMLPFTLAEQYTRRITFLALVNSLTSEAKAKGLTMNLDGVYDEAVRKTDLLQNSYTLANRPQIMRGTRSGLIPLITIFLSFMEHFTFHSTGGFELGNARRSAYLGREASKGMLSSTKRILLFLMLFGGYQALPGAENLLDVLDIIWQHLYNKPFRQELREFTKNRVPEAVPGSHWLNDPRFWSRGLAGDVWGFDVSSSLGIGKIIPGTDVLANPPQNANEFIGKMLSSVGGVAGSFANWAINTMLDIKNNMPIEKDLAKFPGLVGNLESAKQWAQDNKVTGSHGETIYTPSTKDVIGKALGFNPADKAAKQEENWAVKEAVQYWTVQRQLLQQAYNTIRDSGDREALADVKDRIEKFNNNVMDSRMKLRPYQINESYRNHVKTQRQLEAERAAPNARNLSADVRASFGEEGQ